MRALRFLPYLSVFSKLIVLHWISEVMLKMFAWSSISSARKYFVSDGRKRVMQVMTSGTNSTRMLTSGMHLVSLFANTLLKAFIASATLRASVVFTSPTWRVVNFGTFSTRLAAAWTRFVKTSWRVGDLASNGLPEISDGSIVTGFAKIEFTLAVCIDETMVFWGLSTRRMRRAKIFGS